MILNCISMDLVNYYRRIIHWIIPSIQSLHFNVHPIWHYEVHECPNVNLMELGYRKSLDVKVGFRRLSLNWSMFFFLLAPIPCLIPALPRNAHYTHLRPFVQKIPDGNHLEYICDDTQSRQRIICRRGKIIPRNPICHQGRIHSHRLRKEISSLF